MELLPSHLFIVYKFSGIFFSVVLCRTIATIYPSMFSSFRDYTFQIFLMGIFFQMGIRYLYQGLNREELYIPLYIFSILIGIYFPVFISKSALKMPNMIKKCLGL